MQTTDLIWFDGKLVPWDKAQVHVLTHSLHYGSAIFEGIRAYKCSNGQSSVFRLDEHCKRFIKSSKIMLMDLPYSAEQLEQACVELLVANKLQEGYIRPLAFYGYGEMGVFPGKNPVQTIIACWSWGAYLGKEALERGISLKTSSFTRSYINANMSKAKASGNYINSILAKVDAKNDNYDEAIMLDTNGFVSEATGENIFFVIDGAIVTPPLATVLNGITRLSVIKIAKDLGYEVREDLFPRDALYAADEAFLCGTAAEITPIREIDHRQIGRGYRGPITEKIQKVFFKTARGEESKYEKWLTRYSI